MESNEQKMSKEAKQTLIAFIIGILFVIAMFVWQPLMLRYHKKTCGFAFRAYTIRGADYIDYSFQNQNNNWVTAGEFARDYKVRDLKTLQKMGCIKIIYSTLQNGTIEVVDERMVIKE
ncbi:MAG: hypothetical protein RIR55_1519 [Bacteroidota bacterium]|jgi:hypothetical protein